MSYYNIPDDKYKNEIRLFLDHHPNFTDTSHIKKTGIIYRVKVRIPVIEVPEIGSYLGGYYSEYYELYTVFYQHGRIGFNLNNFTLRLGTAGILHLEKTNIRTTNAFRYYSGGNNSIKLYSANDKIYKKRAEFLVESKKHLLNDFAKEVNKGLEKRE